MNVDFVTADLFRCSPQCHQTSQITNPWIATKSLPCCHIYQSRTPWVSSILPPRQENPALTDSLYPWWGLWRTPQSAPLPKVFYPAQIEPRGVVDNYKDGWAEWYTSVTDTQPLVNANWALTK